MPREHGRRRRASKRKQRHPSCWSWRNRHEKGLPTTQVVGAGQPFRRRRALYYASGGWRMTRYFAAAVVLLALVAVPVPMSSAPPSKAAIAMADAANAFLKDLSAEQRSKATFTFDDDSRFEFRYTPRARKGLPIKEMSDAQRQRAHALLKTGTSVRGYTTATTIMD